jgi:hypothetical protein
VRECTAGLGWAVHGDALEKETVGFAWYTEEQWKRLRELANDTGALDDTYGE